MPENLRIHSKIIFNKMFQLKAVKLNRKRWKAQLLFKKIHFEPIAHTLPNLDRSVSSLILPSFSYSKYIFNDKKNNYWGLFFIQQNTFWPNCSYTSKLVRSVSSLILSSFGYSKDIFNNKKKQLLRLIFSLNLT